MFLEANYGAGASGMPYEVHARNRTEKHHARHIEARAIYRISRGQQYGDIPDKSVSLSFYFEANYGLPYEWNSSYFDEGSHFAKRSLSRQLIYRVFMSKMESLGYPGLDCLLKTICDVARFSLRENGVLGDILQIVFTPSMSRNENLPSQITEAEQEQNCNQRYKRCSVNLLDLISH
ncbi:hypothetical protein HN011_011229 [Eciton burchellii]|nr:hypothetical protein HN011_011229 [Eciton burchellii]